MAKKIFFAAMAIVVVLALGGIWPSRAMAKVKIDETYDVNKDPVRQGASGLGQGTIFVYGLVGSKMVKVVGQVVDENGKPLTGGSVTLVDVMTDSLDLTGKTEKRRGVVVELDRDGRFGFFVSSLPNEEWPNYEALFVSVGTYEAYVEFFTIKKLGKYIVGPIKLAKEKVVFPRPDKGNSWLDMNGISKVPCVIKSGYENCLNATDPNEKRVLSVKVNLTDKLNPEYWSAYIGFYQGIPYAQARGNGGLAGILVSQDDSSEAILFTYFFENWLNYGYNGGIGVGDIFNGKVDYLIKDNEIPIPLHIELKSDHLTKPFYVRFVRIGKIICYFYYDAAVNWARYDGPVYDVDTVKIIESGRNSVVSFSVRTR